MSFLDEAALILLGAAISLVSQWVKTFLSRDTHASNRVFELRLEAVAAIWNRYIDLFYEVVKAMSLGHDRWKKKHYDEAEELRMAFRKEIERRQVYLDKEVVEHFRKLDLELGTYMAGDKTDDHDRSISFVSFKNDHLDPRISDLSSAINDSMDKSTHELSLELST
jgi:hypothetical protein